MAADVFLKDPDGQLNEALHLASGIAAPLTASLSDPVAIRRIEALAYATACARLFISACHLSDSWFQARDALDAARDRLAAEAFGSGVDVVDGAIDDAWEFMDGSAGSAGSVCS